MLLRRPTANRRVRLVQVVAPRRSARSARSHRRHPFRGRVRRVLHRGRQSRRAADRHDEEHGVRAGGAASASRSPRRSACLLARTLPRTQSRLERVRVDLTEHQWGRIAVDGATSTATRSFGHGPEVAYGDGDGASATGVTICAGVARSAHPEVVALGVHGVPQGRVHDAAGDARPHSRDVADGNLAVSNCRARLRSGVARRPARRCSRSFAEHDSASVQHTLHAWARRCSTTSTTVAGDPSRHAEQASPARGPVALRPREPQRDLRRHRRALRADRGDDRRADDHEAAMTRLVRSERVVLPDGVRAGDDR